MLKVLKSNLVDGYFILQRYWSIACRPTARVSRRRLYPNRPPRQLKAVGLHAWARAPGLGDPALDRTNLAEPATHSIPAAYFDTSPPRRL